jgi:hypothetical protein
VRGALPSRLHRCRASAWARLFARALAATGLLLTAALAAAGHRGLLCLGFLTAAALVGIAALRAREGVRQAGAAARLHRRVSDALSPLAAGGWQVKHNVRWPEGPGDGHLAMIPGGRLAFAIKDCPEAVEDFDLAQTQEFATALSELGLPYVPVCVGTATGARSLASDSLTGSPLVDHPDKGNTGDPEGTDIHSFTARGVLCCTPEALAAELIDAHRAFLTSLADERAHLQLLYSEGSAA